MRVYIRAPSDEPAEWSLVELQGELEVSGHGGLAGVALGVLAVSGAGVPSLTIGNHQLLGALVPLKKPRAVLRRRREGEGAARVTRYDVVGVARKRYLFKSRPKPVLTSYYKKQSAAAVAAKDAATAKEAAR